MKWRITVAPEYLRDVEDAYHWYEQQEPGVGRRCIESAHARESDIERNPYLFRRIEGSLR